MGQWFTWQERRDADILAIRMGVDALKLRLSAYARAHGGRFVLFGSAARGDLKPDSDIDILVDFPIGTRSDAWQFAERACWDLCLMPDVQPYPASDRAFLGRIEKHAVLLE